MLGVACSMVGGPEGAGGRSEGKVVGRVGVRWEEAVVGRLLMEGVVTMGLMWIGWEETCRAAVGGAAAEEELFFLLDSD